MKEGRLNGTATLKVDDSPLRRGYVLGRGGLLSTQGCSGRLTPRRSLLATPLPGVERTCLLSKPVEVETDVTNLYMGGPMGTTNGRWPTWSGWPTQSSVCLER